MTAIITPTNTRNWQNRLRDFIRKKKNSPVLAVNPLLMDLDHEVARMRERKYREMGKRVG